MSKLNSVYFRQLMGAERRQQYALARSDFFWGLINKASYRYAWRGVIVEPRWKSEWVQQSRSLFDQAKQTTLLELVAVLLETRLLSATKVQAGVEYAFFDDLDRDTEDFNSLSWAFQLATESAYLGYRIQALAGFVVERKNFAAAAALTATQSFVTLYAGLQ